MNLVKVKRIAVLLCSGLIGVYLWFKVLEFAAPQPDGEEVGEIDPDLPMARPGDVLLFNRAKGLNRIITWFTKSPYYHVGISLGDNRVVEARVRGVVIRNLAGPDGDKRFEIISFENVGGQKAAEGAMEWALTQVGDGYDPFNLLSIILDRLFVHCSVAFNLPDRWTCGELVDSAFLETGQDLFPGKKPTDIAPADFAKFLPRGDS